MRGLAEETSGKEREIIRSDRGANMGRYIEIEVAISDLTSLDQRHEKS